MNFTSYQLDGVTVLALEGKCMGGPETMPFMDEVRTLVDGGTKKMVVDLGAVPWMNSAGLGILIAARARLRSAGGQLRLARPNDTVSAVLILNNLGLIFGIHATIDEAVAAFK
jgi:anti-sigma B factor antagonist